MCTELKAHTFTRTHTHTHTGQRGNTHIGQMEYTHIHIHTYTYTHRTNGKISKERKIYTRRENFMCRKTFWTAIL
jgi:hypothetical protein